jgi:ABC-type Mn2+/Zn2+ transport system ATPase subunit
VPVWFDRVLLLNRHVVAAGPISEAFTPDTLRETYGGILPHMMAV